MAPWARNLATALALAGIGVCVFFLVYTVPIAADWAGYLFGDARAQPQYRALANFVGVAASLGSLILVVGLAILLVILKRLWWSRQRPADRA